MKCTIKNMSPKTVGIFARINGADGRFEIGPGKEMIADNYETRIMKIYKKKGLIQITPYVETPKVEQLLESKSATLLSEEIVSVTPDVTPEIIESTDIPKTLQEVEAEVEQYVENGYIKGAWSEEDIAFLKKNYPTKGRKYCSNSLNRNESSVQKKINSMGLKKKKKKK
jgi:hypothetical protein